MSWRAADRAELSERAIAADGPDYVLDVQVGHLLRRAHQRHAAIFQAMMGDDQLTPLQFAALMKLADVGETSQNQLGRLTAMDAATMQGVIKRLIVRGLLERRRFPVRPRGPFRGSRRPHCAGGRPGRRAAGPPTAPVPPPRRFRWQPG